MFSISNNGFITITRGDSFSAPLFINWGTKMVPVRYSMGEHGSTEIYLGVMEPNQPFEKAIIRKKYTNKSDINSYGDIIVQLDPKDTMNLLPGKYFYQVKVKFKDDNVDTIVPKTEFFILE